VLNIPVIRNRIDGGRVVYIPEVKPAIKKPPASAMTSRYWKLPLNWRELVESVKWAAGNKLSIEVNAPLTVTVEITKKLDKSGLMLHLINYDVSRNPLIRNIGVNLTIHDGKKVEQIIVLSPDNEKIKFIEYNLTEERVVFQVPQLEIYDLVVIKLN